MHTESKLSGQLPFRWGHMIYTNVVFCQIWMEFCVRYQESFESSLTLMWHLNYLEFSYVFEVIACVCIVKKNQQQQNSIPIFFVSHCLSLES